MIVLRVGRKLKLIFSKPYVHAETNHNSLYCRNGNQMQYCIAKDASSVNLKVSKVMLERSERHAKEGWGGGGGGGVVRQVFGTIWNLLVPRAYEQYVYVSRMLFWNSQMNGQLSS